MLKVGDTVNDHLISYLTLPIIKEIQTQTIRFYFKNNFDSIRFMEIIVTDYTQFRKRCGEMSLLIHCWNKGKWVQSLRKGVPSIRA
jgi:hypothetical protein